LAALLGIDFNDLLTKHEFKTSVEYCAQRFMMRDGLKNKALVIRASKYGAMVTTTADKQAMHWTPAYWNWKTESHHIVDVTGAGNTFCGGFAYGWLKTNGDPTEAALYGAVSASFTVEQIGVPVLSDNESWNGGQTSPQERLDILKTKSCIF
jgi:sugar/nucleoside kinase (ribokinase family)